MLNVQTCSDKEQEVNDLALLLSCPALQDGPDDFFNILHIGSKSTPHTSKISTRCLSFSQ